MIERIGFTLAIICSLSGIVEGIKYIWASRPILKRKSSKTTSRKYFLTAVILLTPQFIYAIWGMFFPAGHNRYVWPLIMTITLLGNTWILYLACKYKRKDGRFVWPTWTSI